MTDELEKTVNIVRSGAPEDQDGYTETPSGAQLAWRRRSELVSQGIDPDSGEHETLARDEFAALDQPVVMSDNLLAAAERLLEQDVCSLRHDPLDDAARVLSSHLIAAARDRRPAQTTSPSWVTGAEIMSRETVRKASRSIVTERAALVGLAAPIGVGQQLDEITAADVSDLLVRFVDDMSSSGELGVESTLEGRDLDELLVAFLRRSVVMDAGELHS